MSTFYRTGAGTLEANFQSIVINPSPFSYPWPPPPKPRNMIILVETYALTSFLGNYGAGRVVSTFNLLPNEKTKISLKTWKTTETTAKQASSF